MSIDYARECENVYDLHQIASELKAIRLEESANYMMDNEIESVLIEMVYTLEPEEVKELPKLLKGDKTMLGIMFAKAINRTALELAELGES